jgi:uncharacterized repeat protein (TIGR01451 family)
MIFHSEVRAGFSRRGGLLLGLALLTVRPAAADLKLLSLPAKDLVYDPARHRIYASVAAKAGASGNSVAIIDPVTGTVGPTIPVGSDPGKMALSDDGRYLYVGLDGANAVRRIDLQTQKPDLQFSLGGDKYDPYTVDDMQVVPGSPRSVAIARRRTAVSPDAAGVAIYDDGVPRPKVTDRSDRIQFSASPTRLYGLFEGEFIERMSVDASGATLLDDKALSRSVGAFDFKYADGRLYLSDGHIVDPEQRQVIDTFPNVPYPSLVLPDPEVDRVYFLAFPDGATGNLPKLLAYDRRTLLQVGSQAIPISLEEASGFIKWGTDGLAFRTDRDQVVLLRTRLRTPNVTSADLAVTGSVSPNPVRVGDALAYQIWVQNYGPDPEPDAVLSSVLPAGTTFVSVSSSQGHCSRSGTALTCDLGALPSGARAIVTLVVQPTRAGTLINTVTVHGQTPDPYSGNNTATQRTIAALPVPCATGPGQCLPVFAAAVQQLSLAARDLVYDPVTQRIYASVPSSAGAIGNSVVSIDPVTGAVGAPIPVGSEPGKLARSDDGHYLYVALDGAGAVRRVDLRAQTAGLQFSLGPNPAQGPVLALDLQVVPGDPEAVAVAGRRGPGYYGLAGVTIYDNGVPRARTTAVGSDGSTEIQFSSSASRLYGYNSEATWFSFQRMAVDDLGVGVLDTASYLVFGVFGLSPAMQFDQGLLFTTSGRVIDPEARLLLGTVPNLGNQALLAPDHAAGQLFYLTGDGSTRQLRIYDSCTLLPLATIGVPNVQGHAGSLIRWGQKQSDGLGGLAFLTDANQVFLLHLLLLDPTDLTVTVSPAAIVSGSTATATVTLSRPAPPGGAVLVLSSATPAVASVPPTVLVPAGATSASFAVTTRPVRAASDVELTASYAGVERTAALRLLPANPPLAALSVSPRGVVGGASALGTVRLASPAPEGGRAVGLSTGNPAVAGVPPYVIVPTGATTASFPITTGAVADATYVPIWAAGGEVRTAGLWVLPVGLSLTPDRVRGGRYSTGIVILPTPAPPGGAPVTLFSANPAVASVPASVTVPAGATTLTFPVRTVSAAGPTTVVISAASGGTTWTRTLMVVPGP